MKLKKQVTHEVQEGWQVQGHQSLRPVGMQEAHPAQHLEAKRLPWPHPPWPHTYTLSSAEKCRRRP